MLNLGPVLLRQIEIHHQIGHLRNRDQHLSLADFDARLHVEIAPATVGIGINHHPVDRRGQLHHGHVLLVAVELLLGAPDPAAVVLDRLLLLDQFRFGGDLDFAQIQLRLFKRIGQPGHLARVVVAAEHLAVVLGCLQILLRLVDLALGGLEFLTLLLVGVLVVGDLDLAVADRIVIVFLGFQRLLGVGDRQIERVAGADPLEPAVFAQRVVRLRKSLLRLLKFGGVGAEQDLLGLDRKVILLAQIVQLDLMVLDLFEQAVGFELGEQVSRLDLAVLVDHPEKTGPVVGLQRKLVLLAGVHVTALRNPMIRSSRRTL